MINLSRRFYNIFAALVLAVLFSLGTSSTALAVVDTSGSAITVSYLGWFSLTTDSNSSIVVGDSTLYYQLYDQTGAAYTPKSGLTAAITDPNGNVTHYTAGSSSVSNIYLDQAGVYSLTLSDSTGAYTQSFTVKDAQVSTAGKLALNYSSTVTLKLMDSDGNILPRRSITVDATGIGGQAISYTTLYDGTLTFTMTPTSQGKINFTRNGHVIGSLAVTPAYSSNSRIGDSTSDNATRSVLVSQKGWTTSKYVILTRDDIVADAMVAVPLAKKYNAPILMTPTGALNSSVLNEIKRLGAETVFIIGGEGAVSSSVENQLKGNGIYTNRLAGTDRYDTAAKIAYWIGGSSGTVYLAYGYGEPDALAVSALAAEQGIPILLTDSYSLPDSTRNELAALAPRSIKLLGGTGVISSDLEQLLRNSYMVERWGGSDRYATEQIIFQNFFANQKLAANNYPVYFTSAYVSPTDVTGGTPYGDALFTAALAAQNNGFVITLPPNDIPSAISTFLLYNKVYIPSSTVVGNSTAISYPLEAKLNQLLAR